MLAPSFSRSLASLLVCAATAFAGFNPSSQENVAIYWGQNSYGQSSGSLEQQRLSYYCSNTEIDIIPLAFLVSIASPVLNFANAGNDCTAISGSTLFYCAEIEADIAECQSTYGKTILLSIGGATYTEGGFSTSDAAVSAANNIWSIFGPYSASAVRPFGTSVVDGFDFDFESTVSNMPAFGNQLRALMNADSSKSWYLSAAPQCPYPDAADSPMLDGSVYFDFVWVQFYNNYCGLQSYVAGSSTQNNFNFETWDNWAKTVSANPNVKVFLGIPGSGTAAGSGYETGSSLAAVISYSKAYSSFGGVMIWDASQVYANTGFLDGVTSDLGRAALSPSPTTPGTITSTSTSTGMRTSTTTSVATTLTTITTITTTAPTATATVGAGTVAHWNQCAGQGWTGGTVCIAPWVCTEFSIWYSQCE